MLCPQTYVSGCTHSSIGLAGRRGYRLVLRPLQALTLRLVAAFAACVLPLAAQSAPRFDRLVVFGDSVSDVGNGSIIWNQQSAAPYQAAIPQNNYSNNRYTDGPDTNPSTSQPALIWTDLLAADLGLAAPTASLAGGTNYAAFGATTMNGSAQYPSVDMQVQQAISSGISPNSLYVFWGGANDITDQTDPNVVTGAAMAAAQSIARQISLLIAAGAKNFVWINMPALDRLPGSASPNPILNNAFAQACIAYDQQEAASIASLKSVYLNQGASIVGVDAYALFTNILNAPSAYGFANVSTSASGLPVNPDSYFFWQGGHFTTTGHGAVAAEIFKIVRRQFSGDGTITSGSGPANGNLDYDGDGRPDLMIWRPSDGSWYLNPSNGAWPVVTQWGLPSDVPVPGDYDGDGIADRAVWRPSNGTWYIIPSRKSTAPYTVQWGVPGDIPVPGDYDGDKIIDFAVWRPSNGSWYIIPSSAPGSPYVVQWGLAGDIPVPGDYDGDRRADFAVWRPYNGTWYVLRSGSPGNPAITQWGLPWDIPMPGDYDGDGKVDYAVWRPSNGTWYVIPSASGLPNVVSWGIPGDIPVYGDFDGDQKTDFAVWRPATGSWYIIPSSNPGAPEVTQWGIPEDIPR